MRLAAFTGELRERHAALHQQRREAVRTTARHAQAHAVRHSRHRADPGFALQHLERPSGFAGFQTVGDIDVPDGFGRTAQRPVAQQLTFVDNQDARREFFDLAEDMAADQCRDALLREVFDDLAQLRDALGVKSVGGFVQQQQLRRG